MKIKKFPQPATEMLISDQGNTVLLSAKTQILN